MGRQVRIIHFFFQSNHRYWLSLRFTSLNFVFIKEAKIIDYLGKLCNSFYFTLYFFFFFLENVEKNHSRGVSERVGQVTVNKNSFHLMHEKKSA